MPGMATAGDDALATRGQQCGPISTFKANDSALESQFQQLCRERNWPPKRLSTSARDLDERIEISNDWAAYNEQLLLLKSLKDDLLRDLCANSHEVDSSATAGALWGYVVFIAIPALSAKWHQTRAHSLEGQRQQVDDVLLGVYHALHRLKIPWASESDFRPPYGILTRGEQLDVLQNVVNRLERDEIECPPAISSPLPVPALADERTTVEAVYLGDRRYRVGNAPAIVLTESEDFVLRSLIDLGGAADKPKLMEQTGKDDCHRVLAKIRQKYDQVLAPFVSTPGRRGAGGYTTTIRRAE
jgi:hypothetical protein